MRLPGCLRFDPKYLVAVICLGLVLVILKVAFLGPEGSPDIEATGIRPADQGAGMSADGDFTAVFYNGLGAPIYVHSIWVADAENVVSRCWTNSTIDVPAGGSFEARLSGCGQRKAGEGFKVNVRIDYELDSEGSPKRQTQIGILDGTVG